MLGVEQLVRQRLYMRRLRKIAVLQARAAFPVLAYVRPANIKQ